MEQFIIKNQGLNTYLEYEISSDEVVDHVGLGMLTNNQIPGLAAMTFTQMDDKKFFRYNITSKVTIERFFSSTVNKKKLMAVFEGILNAMLSVEDYMIDTRNLLLHTDFIYVDPKTYETSLICLPISNKVCDLDIGTLYKKIMFSVKFDQSENCDYIALIINYLNGANAFSVYDFRNLLDQINTTPSHIGNINSIPNNEEKKSVPYSKFASVIPSGNLPPKTAVPKSTQTSAQSRPAPVQNKPQDRTDSYPKEKMSVMKLLMHYSKENAELYRAQKEERKKAKSAYHGSSKQGSGKKKSANMEIRENAQFAIPGQEIEKPEEIRIPNEPSQKEDLSKESAEAHKLIYVPENVSQGESANYGETIFVGEESSQETVFVGAVPYLIRKSNNERILLSKKVNLIGKSKTGVDYTIKDNATISRQHAKFIVNDDACYVIDIGSMNHTYVNGEKIESNVPVQISHGSVIRLSNEDFELKMY